MPHVVPEQPAQVTHFLPEGGGRGIWIVLGVEQQRVAAPGAHVFVAAVAVGEFLVVVLAEEARQRMPHPGDRAVFGQVVTAAPAPPVAAIRALEGVIVDVMAPEET